MKRVWHSGPPLHIGWWNASLFHQENSWRWWDGKDWSHAAYDWSLIHVAVKKASLFGAHTDEVLWTDYWPENARVPRIDPRVGGMS